MMGQGVSEHTLTGEPAAPGQNGGPQLGHAFHPWESQGHPKPLVLWSRN